MVGLANVGRAVDVALHPAIDPAATDLLAPGDANPWRLASLQVRWITADAAYKTSPAPGDSARSTVRSWSADHEIERVHHSS